MKDLALKNDDLSLTNFDLSLLDDVDQILQSVKIRLRFFKGEWYLDSDAGLPYLTDILVKGPDTRGHVESLFKRAILNTPEIVGLKSFGLAFDSATRALKVTFAAETSSGTITSNEVSLNG